MSVTDRRINPQHLERIVAKTKLGTGYFHADELGRRTGQPPDMFAAVVLKELLDNALDACESVAAAPKIFVETYQRADGGSLTISVSDNAGGIPPETVAGILDFNVSISDKSVYRSPTRGQMGNAWKTIIGIPYALGGKKPITITGRERVESDFAERRARVDGVLKDLRDAERALMRG